MEQLSLTAGKEKENVVQILTDLMEHNREFQIMITVPPERQRRKLPGIICTGKRSAQTLEDGTGCHEHDP